MPHIQDFIAQHDLDNDPVSNWDWQSYIDRVLENGVVENAEPIPNAPLPHDTNSRTNIIRARAEWRRFAEGIIDHGDLYTALMGLHQQRKVKNTDHMLSDWARS
jgi:hypothetical protein